MYFSKIELCKNHPRLLETLDRIRQQNGYDLHQLIWSLFADSQQPTKQRDFLYRQESQANWPTFYTVSNTLPQNIAGIWSIHTKVYQPQIGLGEQFYFSLRVNPRLIKYRPDGTKFYCDAVMDLKKQRAFKTTTYEIIQEAALNWLNKRCERRGFKVAQAIAEGYQQHKLYKAKQLIQYSTLDYQGILTITDTESFLKTLQKGIGAAKGFGCGLLLIKRR